MQSQAPRRYFFVRILAGNCRRRIRYNWLLTTFILLIFSNQGGNVNKDFILGNLLFPIIEVNNYCVLSIYSVT